MFSLKVVKYYLLLKLPLLEKEVPVDGKTILVMIQSAS